MPHEKKSIDDDFKKWYDDHFEIEKSYFTSAVFEHVNESRDTSAKNRLYAPLSNMFYMGAPTGNYRDTGGDVKRAPTFSIQNMIFNKRIY